MMTRLNLQNRSLHLILPLMLVLGLGGSMMYANGSQLFDQETNNSPCCSEMNSLSCGNSGEEGCTVKLDMSDELSAVIHDYRAEIQWPRIEKVN